MKRSRIIAAALIVAMLISVFSVGALAHPTDAEFEFEGPDVVRVIVDYNFPPPLPPGATWTWPGTITRPRRPFSDEEAFRAPLGTPGVDHLLIPPDPHAPDPTQFDVPLAPLEIYGYGWVTRGTRLNDIRTGAWGEAWGPWYVPGGPHHLPFVNFAQGTMNRFPLDPVIAGTGIFEFDYWRTGPTGGARIFPNTQIGGDPANPANPMVTSVTLYARWSARREVRIRHRFTGGPSPAAAIFTFPLEQRPDGGQEMRVGDSIDLGANTTNLHLQFIGFDFFTFNGWTVAVGNENSSRPTSHVPTLTPGVFGQVVTIPYPDNFDDLAAGRLYFIANWRVRPPGTGVWVPPPPPEGGGGGGGTGAGGGQQTSPPAGGGVIGGGVGAGLPPGYGAWDRDDYDTDGFPFYTAVPGTGGAPLIPIVTTFPAAPSASAPLPRPFTPAPGPSAPVVVEVPPIAVPIVGLDSNTWALMNLILAIVGAIAAVATVIHVWRKNRNRREAGIDFEAEEESRKRRKQWLFAVGLVSIVSAVLFPLTQDMSNRMTLLDVWTIAHVILLAAQVVATWQILRRKERYDDGDGGNLDIAQANA